MARKNTSMFKVAAGLAVGALATYGIVKALEKEEPKKKKSTDEPPGPGPDEGLPGMTFDPAPQPGPGMQWDPAPEVLQPGEVGPHRAPLPTTAVPLPFTETDLLALNQALCAYLAEGTQYNNPATIAYLALDRIAPEVTWPTVQGDHPSLIALESIVLFRARQIGLFNPELTVHENFVALCELLPEEAQPGDIGG